MRKPSLLSGASLDDLEKLTADYPFSPVTHLLYIKALSEQKSIHYHSRLKLTAAHVFDRSVLYYLLNAGEESSVVPAERKEIAVSPPRKEIVTPVRPAIPADAVKNEPQDGWDELIRRVKNLTDRQVPALEDISGKLTHLQEEHEKRVEDIARAYFALREIALNVRLAELVPEAEDVAADEPAVETTPQQEPFELPPSGQKELKRSSKKAALIDKFIEAAPSMPKPKKEFFNPTNMAQSSTLDKEDLVTETLALIHVKQGNIQKALKIYQRLCLIIPEKSAYFAAQIEKIKKENNLL